MILEAGKSKMINVLANSVSPETFLVSLLEEHKSYQIKGPTLMALLILIQGKMCYKRCIARVRRL